jgi:hypothetical protein
MKHKTSECKINLSADVTRPEFSASQEGKNQAYVLNTRTSQSYFSYDMFCFS